MYGIPNMKLEKSIVQRRLELMAAQGVEFRTGVDVGRDISARELRRGYDAVVLCCGAANPRDLDLPGREGGGGLVRGGLFEGDHPGPAGQRPAGGHLPLRQGEARGDRGRRRHGQRLRGHLHPPRLRERHPAGDDAQGPGQRGENNPWPEWPRVCKTDYGQEEAIAVFGSDPRIYETTVSRLIRDEGGALTAVGDRPPGAGSQAPARHGADPALRAAAHRRRLPGPPGLRARGFGLARTARSNVQTAEGGYDTSVAGVFAAGDMRRGQSLVVWAIQEGRAAARQVDEYLMGYTNLE